MTTTHRSRNAILTALALGLVGDQLLHLQDWGINLPIFVVLLCSVMLLSPPSRSDQGNNAGRITPWPWLAAFTFASMWSLRTSEELLAVNLVAMLTMLSLGLLQARGYSLRAGRLVNYLTAPPLAVFYTITGAAALIGDGLKEATGANRWKMTVLGLLISIPLVLFFGSLFMSADPIFESGVKSIFGTSLPELIPHVMLTVALALITGGGLWTARSRGSLMSLSTGFQGVRAPLVSIPLGVTAALFACFIAVQAESMFGGEAFVRAHSGLNLAQYARSGFFELMVASLFALPMVYGAPGMVRKETDGSGKTLRLLMATQLVLMTLVLISAIWRLKLYIAAWGLTEDRIYGLMVMLWVGATMVIIAATVLRGKKEGAPFGAMIAAVVLLLGLNAMNPEATIARYNLTAGRMPSIDLEHLASIGGDAAPVVVERWALVPEDKKCSVARNMVKDFGTLDSDWRSWNLARNRAHDAVQSLKPLVIQCGPEQPQPEK